MTDLIQQPINIPTPLDEHGLLLDTERILEESLHAYKLRLLDVNANRANSTYNGLINGITRELGLQKRKALRIDLKPLYVGSLISPTVISSTTLTDSSKNWVPNSLIGFGLKIGTSIYKIINNTDTVLQISHGNLSRYSSGDYHIVAYNPVVIIDSSTISLYRDYYSVNNYRLDSIINLRDGSNTFIEDVTDAINASTYFTAVDLTDDNSTDFCKLLLKQSSLQTVSNEQIPHMKRFRLANKSIIQSSIRFSEKNVFSYEVLEENLVAQSGNYFIDYASGLIMTATVPSGTGTVSYKYSSFPFDVFKSPIVINNFNDKSVENFLFEQIEMDTYDTLNDRYISGKPKSDMIEYTSELLNVTPLMWGQ